MGAQVFAQFYVCKINLRKAICVMGSRDGGAVRWLVAVTTNNLTSEAREAVFTNTGDAALIK